MEGPADDRGRGSSRRAALVGACPRPPEISPPTSVDRCGNPWPRAAARFGGRLAVRGVCGAGAPQRPAPRRPVVGFVTGGLRAEPAPTSFALAAGLALVLVFAVASAVAGSAGRHP